MFIKTGIKLSIVCMSLIISACDSFKNDSLKNICSHYPELCSDLYIIGDCRFKRTTVIRARYYDHIEPNEIHTRQLLSELDEYQACLEMTLHLQFTRNKQRKDQRLHNYLTAQDLMKANLQANKQNQDPMLAYYLWTHHQDLYARRIFLSAATQKDITDPKLLFKLATVNSKNAPQQALNIFYKGLSVSDSLQEIPLSSFVHMMTLFYQHKQFNEAYIWALIAKEEDKNNEFPINLTLILNKGIVGGKSSLLNENALQIKAKKYYQQLTLGEFEQTAPILRSLTTG
ncbi:hypothetical protein GCM10007916_27060 [Psychromonas marina]|uniref:DUF2989 domain-containing protein n=1 Tax=Psychromonas marina TaxID=88364 RepID=A0ABQ6E2N0_9GAMM|nr:DUF2989 domain-containing protein [Psychromonas marina]GLS91637.1 hypothetical protein GCM10007916_27060 [Psychromonas marina]